jgi:hypothetical protein
MKKERLFLLFIFCFCVFLIYKCNKKKEEKIMESKIDLLLKQRLSVPRIAVTNTALKLPTPFTLFTNSVKEAQFENLIMIGKVGKWGVEGDEGKVLRALRFKNITDSIESRYNLPPLHSSCHDGTGIKWRRSIAQWVGRWRFWFMPHATINR